MTLTTRFQPLYKQVYDLLVARLVEGHWKPAEPLPSEHALAAELEVSQGTVRKALNQMVSENLLKRRQGKGTFVAEHTQESLYRFFRFREPGGESMVPETDIISVSRRGAQKNEGQALEINEGAKVVEMVRVRSLKGEPTILETIIQPLSVFPDIDKRSEIPNSLYTLYQTEYGISVVEVREDIRAAQLDAEQATLLKLKPGTPVLKVERASVNIDGRVVEWSEAYCSTEHFVYAVSLR